ncbi:putative ribonucleotide transport ATP-binding protein mkl [Paraconexibacter sp. AEG42_29]|uniref:Ribonucleotide transport ATP-binding protein mkl n=1 Tax=Paraconexibacter sp. AEG42_29 TaxID=2997339 RepID=A0AAU7B177_9ACTN
MSSQMSEVDSLTGGVADTLAVEIRGVHKWFGRSHILRGMDLAIPEGSLAVVLGPSGTGKSVLIQHITGIVRPDQGEVLVRGRALSRMSRSEVLKLRTDIGVMFQDGALFSSMDVFENVAFPLRQHTDLNDSEVHDVVSEHLAAVGLSDAGRRFPSQLSGGMKKRAGLARALVLDPGIVICDEPDSGLDPVRTALLADLLRERHAELGGTMIVVTHNMPLARRVADYAAVLWQGGVVESGPAEVIFNSSNEFVAQFVSSSKVGPLGMD